MYPMTQWGHAGVAERLEALLEAKFFHETVVASVQVMEQAFKRVLRSYMVQHRVSVQKSGRWALTQISASSREVIDIALRNHAQSIGSLNEVWKVVVSGQSNRLPALVDAFSGHNTWSLLVTAKPVATRVAGRRLDAPYGLFTLR
ncbi:MAG: hypothetical protein KC766_25075, partial [Myxococcales bacterium]|nr:hypothetical protein [Myxococcales bacterium]